MTEPTEALRLRRLEPDKADHCVALSAEAGWNQTEADWRLMLTLGAGVGFFIGDDTLVATAIALPFGDRFAWISMVLVSRPYRHRGLATRLMENRLTYCENMGLPAVLDATDAGRPIYAPLGFRDLWRIVRLEANGLPGLDTEPQADIPVRPLAGDDLDWISRYDAASFGANRAEILRHLYCRKPDRAFVAEAGDGLRGFVLARDGRLALHVGPLVADDAATAIALAARAMSRVKGRVFVDAVDRPDSTFTSWLYANAFAVQRPFTRMRREPGSQDRQGDSDDAGRFFAVAGPELG